MTRIAGIPEELRSASSLLADSAPDLDLLARTLAAAPLPEMPAGVAAAVQAALADAARTLQSAATISASEAVDLKKRGLWLEVADTSFEAWALVMTWKPFADAGELGVEALARRRATRLLKIWERYQSTVIPIVEDSGPSSPQAARILKLFKDRRGLSDADLEAILGKGGDIEAYNRMVAFPVARAIAERGFPVVGFLSGAVETVYPEHHGWQGVGDRISGASAAAGSGLGLYTTLVGAETAAAFIPGVNVIAGGLVLASTGWEIYTHRKAIAHALVQGGSFVLHHPLVLAGPAGAEAQAVWDHRQQIAHAVVSAGDWGVQRVEDAAKPAVSAYHKISHLLGGL